MSARTCARRVRRLLAAGAVVAAAGTLAGPATPAPAAGNLAVEPGGQSHVLFQTPYRLKVRRQDAAGSLDAGAVAYAVPSGHSIAKVFGIAVDARGRETIAWLERLDKDNYAVRGRRRGADGGFWPVRTIATGAGLKDGSMDIDRNGNAILVWTAPVDGRAAAQVRRWSVAGTLSQIQTLDSYYPSKNPTVAVNPTGTAVIAWNRTNPYRVVARRRSASGAVGALKVLSDAEQRPDVQIADSGSALIAYAGSARRLRADGTLGPTLTYDSLPSFDLEPDGTASVAYLDWHDAKQSAELRLAAWRADGALSAAETFVPTEPQPGWPTLEVDPAAGTSVTWSRYYIPDPYPGYGGRFNLMTRHRTADGTFGEVETLGGGYRSVGDAEMAAAADGTLTYYWTARDEASELLFLTRRRAPGGSLGPTTPLKFG